MRLVLGCRLSETTSFEYRVRRRQPLGARRHRSAGAAGLPAPNCRSPAMHGRSCALRSTASSTMRSSTPRQSTSGKPERGRPGSLGGGDGRRRRRDGPGVHPGRTIATLRRVLPDDDRDERCRQLRGLAQPRVPVPQAGHLPGPTSGAMGYGLPAAIAAALVHRDRPAVALVGDGGLGMTLAELETAVRERARVIVVVFDNQRYGTIRMWQERRGSGQGVATESRRFRGHRSRVWRAGASWSAMTSSSRPCAGTSPNGRRSSRSRSTRRGSRWATGPSAEGDGQPARRATTENDSGTRPRSSGRTSP